MSCCSISLGHALPPISSQPGVLASSRTARRRPRACHAQAYAGAPRSKPVPPARFCQRSTDWLQLMQGRTRGI
eukprot:1399608-Pleurochrysis_carterae.AAC.4